MADQRPSLQANDSLFLGPQQNENSTRSGTMVSGDYAFNPEQHGGYGVQEQYGYGDQPHNPYDSRSGTLLDAQGYFSTSPASSRTSRSAPASTAVRRDTRPATPSSPTAAIAPRLSPPAICPRPMRLSI